MPIKKFPFKVLIAGGRKDFFLEKKFDQERPAMIFNFDYFSGNIYWIKIQLLFDAL